MKRGHVPRFRSGSMAAMIAVLVPISGSFPAVSGGANRQTDLVLRYLMPEGQVLRYQMTSTMKENREVMGQTLTGEAKTESAFSFRSKGQKKEDFILQATVEDMSMAVSSAQGNFSADTGQVRGKSFEMTLSPAGLERDVSGAESITYALAGATRNLAAQFSAFFPDLPGEAVKIGSSWPSSYTIKDKTSFSDIKTEFQNLSTLEAFEKVEGMDCARIKTDFTGRTTGTGYAGGANLSISGQIKGTQVWYFAAKKGIFVKATSESTSQLTMEVSGAQTMTIPLTQERKIETVLLK